MINIRHSLDRGHTSLSWLDSFHTFSFGEYNDPRFMGVSHLRVINQDTVKPGQGFSTHSHQDMEIISYVTQGELAHKDSLGHGSVIKPGEIQRMSAGSGIQHSEFNHSSSHPVNFLQIWVIPNKKGIEPSYEQEKIPQKSNEWILLAAPDTQQGLVTIHQDTKLYAAHIKYGARLDYQFNAARCGWIQIVKGKVCINDAKLSAGDGAEIFDEKNITVISKSDEAELLFFDLEAI